MHDMAVEARVVTKSVRGAGDEALMSALAARAIEETGRLDDLVDAAGVLWFDREISLTSPIPQTSGDPARKPESPGAGAMAGRTRDRDCLPGRSSAGRHARDFPQAAQVAQIPGRRSPHGRARSSCPARRMSVASSPQRATKCTPTGSPDAVQCSGREIAGWPLALAIQV